MTSLTIEQHRGLVDDLLAGLRREGGRPEGQHLTDWLAIDAAALAEHPEDYRGRVLAEDLYATGPLPAFDNSQMDGYAVRSADLRGASADSPVTLTVSPRIVAGETGEALEPGQATPIMTGAPIPAGADAVVPIERVDPPRFGDHERVRFSAEVASGTFVRRAGSDVATSELLLAAGAELGPAALGVIAHSGLGSVEVRSRPHVLLVPTGHEIRPPGWVLEPGQIYDANSFTLGLALQQAGCLVTIAPCTSDDPEDFLAILRAHAEDIDLVLTIGGVSAGAREVVRESLQPLGARFHHVAMQPGGPQGLGLVDIALEDPAAPIAGPGAGLREQPSAPRVRRLPVICFPGNPVSGLVSFEIFLRPFLLAAGGREGSRPSQRVPLADSVDSPAGKHQVRRGVLTLDGTALPVGGPSSHLLHSYALSSILIHIPADATHLDAGEPVEVWTIS